MKKYIFPALMICLAVVFSAIFVYADGIELNDVSIDYKDKNMTIEFKDGLEVLGQATLKSHKTYDEVLEITSGKNKTVIWYEFSGFVDIQKDALVGVEFIDMKEMIENKTYLKQFEGEDFEKMNNSLILIKNPNYLLPIEKDYKFVYKDGDDWIDYNLKEIPKENMIIGVQTDLGWGEFLDVRLNIFDNSLDRHALVLGTNCGFVTEAPTGDPGGYTSNTDNFAAAIKDVSSVGAGKIVEIGWYCVNPTEESNFEVGLYDHDAVGDDAEDLLYVERTNAKGTDAGWKRVTGLNWEIDADTIYWIAIQLDETDTITTQRMAISGGLRIQSRTNRATLPSPWGSPNTDAEGWLYSIYAVWEEGASDTCTCPGDGENWEIDLSDYCIIADACNIGNGACEIGGLPANQIGYLDSDAIINLGGSC